MILFADKSFRSIGKQVHTETSTSDSPIGLESNGIPFTSKFKSIDLEPTGISLYSNQSENDKYNPIPVNSR